MNKKKKEKFNLINLLKNKKILISVVIMLILVIVTIVIIINFKGLNNVENQTYDRLIEFIETGDFYNPKEVRLLDAVISYEYDNDKREYSDTIKYYYVKISGTNKVSGTINKCYEIYYSSYKNEWTNSKESCEDIYKIGKSYEQLSRKSIKNINNALKDYWKELGL